MSAGPAWAMAGAGPPLHPAPRPRRARHPRRRARAHLRPVHGPRGRHHRRARRQRALRRPHQGLRRHGLDAPRHDARSPPGWRWRSSCAASSACAITWFGDGSTSRGDFHEAMNWAGVQQLPVIFVLENNQYAYSTPVDQQFAVDPVERAAAYGFPGVKVDGNDPEAMFEVDAHRPRARARRRGPDADRGRDDAHARPRRARRHEVRAEGAGRGVAARRTRSTARSGASRRSASTSHALRAEVKAEIERRRRGGAGQPDARRRDRAPTACSPTSPRCSRTATRPGRGFKEA